MGYPRNILGFDMKNDLELKTYKFLMGLGRAKSRILKLVLYDAFLLNWGWTRGGRLLKSLKSTIWHY